MAGKDLCYHHGGKTPRGRALPQFKHGRYSKDLPSRIAARYEESQHDPDLLNLSDEVHLTRAMLGETLRQLDTGESGRLWRKLREQWDALRTAQRDKDAAAVATHLNEIGSLIARGNRDHEVRLEAIEITDKLRKLVESESKRRQAMQQMITAEQAMVLVARVVDVVMRHVDEPSVRAAISADIRAIVDGGDRGGD